MDQSAISLIQQTAIAAEKANRLETPTPAAIINGQVVSLEHLGEGRSRFRGNYATDSLDSFAEYVKGNGSADFTADVFIDTEKMSTKAFFNLGDVADPGHGDWTAVLKLKPTPEFSAMHDVKGKKLDQRALVEWIEDWGSCIVPIDSEGQAIQPKKALAAIRKLTIKATSEATHQDKDFGARRSAIEEIEASAEEGIPYALGFTVVPYVGLQQRSFTLRLSVLTGGDKPILVLRPVGLESAIEAIAQEFRRVLADRVGDAASLHIGTFTP
jgi:uncharacterized protein YfdQ (DUF2303 family)